MEWGGLAGKWGQENTTVTFYRGGPDLIEFEHSARAGGLSNRRVEYSGTVSYGGFRRSIEWRWLIGTGLSLLERVSVVCVSAVNLG